jgi:hypothetical protein
MIWVFIDMRVAQSIDPIEIMERVKLPIDLKLWLVTSL